LSDLRAFGPGESRIDEAGDADGDQPEHVVGDEPSSFEAQQQRSAAVELAHRVASKPALGAEAELDLGVQVRPVLIVGLRQKDPPRGHLLHQVQSEPGDGVLDAA
jgi:hypothetical protein